jgi:hypothetical protein
MKTYLILQKIYMYKFEPVLIHVRTKVNPQSNSHM